MPTLEDSAGLTTRIHLSKVPAFPPIAMRLLGLLANRDVGMDDLAELVLSDASFSGEVLRLVNSPLFAFEHQITSVQYALVVLGVDSIRKLALTIAAGNYLKAALKFEELRRCWRHTLACAMLTEELAQASGLHLDRAYAAGLLHDLGRLGLLVAHPDEYADLLRMADRNALELLDYEEKMLGMDHCQAGRELAEAWNLPQEFRIIAGRHHDPPGAASDDLLSLVHWGCQLADVLGFHVNPPLQPTTFEQIKAALPAAARDRLVMDAEQLRELVESRIRAHDSSELATPALPLGAKIQTLGPAAEASAQLAPTPIEFAIAAPPPSSAARTSCIAAAAGLATAGIFWAFLYLAR